MKNCLYLLLLLMVASIVSCNRSSDSGGSPSGTESLEWTAPTTNSDGSALTDLAGYKVYYGTSSGSYPQSIDVGNVTRYDVKNFPGGFTYYFVVRAYSREGVESDPSNEISKEIKRSDQPD